MSTEVSQWMRAGNELARELRRRCNTKWTLLHQSVWYEAANELEKFAAEIIARHCPDTTEAEDRDWNQISLALGFDGPQAEGSVGRAC